MLSVYLARHDNFDYNFGQTNDNYKDTNSSHIIDDNFQLSHIIIGGDSQITGRDDKTGGVIVYDNDKTEQPEKSTIIESAIPNIISEFSLTSGCKHGQVCAPDNVVDAMADKLNMSYNDPSEVIELAKSKLNCETEKCVVIKMANMIKNRVPDIGNIILKKYKIKGPTDAALLNNVVIDNTLKQWSVHYSDFFPYNFNMVNYASYSLRHGKTVNEPDTLATIMFDELYNDKFRCCGCVINSDKYQGEGKHWMALFADARDKHTWTVEFFNSSGNPPVPEWVSWLAKTKLLMEKISKNMTPRPKIKVIKSTMIRHQHSKTECGVYSLFYIWSRLNNISPEYFQDNPIPDQLMFEFRQHLFDSPLHGETFDWQTYSKTTKIDWEK